MGQHIKKNVFHLFNCLKIIIIYIRSLTWEQEFMFNFEQMLLAAHVWPDKALLPPPCPSNGTYLWHESKKTMEISKALLY